MSSSMDYAGDPIRETIDRLVTLFRTCSPDIRSSTQACRWEAANHRQLGASKAAIPGLSGACRLPARQAVTGPQTSLLGGDLKCERDALAAADAQSHDAALETVAVHRVDEAGRQHGARRSHRIAMRNRASFDIDYILRQTELARHDDRDRRKRLVDLDAIDVGELPPGAVERLAHRWDGSKPEHPRLYGRDAVRDEPCCQTEAAAL